MLTTMLNSMPLDVLLDICEAEMLQLTIEDGKITEVYNNED